jgi:hypothetical protein
MSTPRKKVTTTTTTTEEEYYSMENDGLSTTSQSQLKNLDKKDDNRKIFY